MSIYSRYNIPRGFYVYAYIRKNDTPYGKAGTPYYIGKGKNRRAWFKNKQERVQPPNDSLIVVLAANLTETGAFAIERKLIRLWGRIHFDVDGHLINLADGGQGSSTPMSIEQRLSRTGDKNAFFGKSHTQETKLKISDRSYRKQSGGKHYAARRVLLNGVEYGTVRDAAISIGISENTLRDYLKGRIKKQPTFSAAYIQSP